MCLGWAKELAWSSTSFLFLFVFVECLITAASCAGYHPIQSNPLSVNDTNSLSIRLSNTLSLNLFVVTMCPNAVATNSNFMGLRKYSLMIRRIHKTLFYILFYILKRSNTINRLTVRGRLHHMIMRI